MSIQVSDDDILADLRSVARGSGDNLTVREYNRRGKYSRKSVERHFGSWNEGKGRAGLDVCSTGSETPAVPSDDGLNKERRWKRVKQIKECLPCEKCGRNAASCAMDFHHETPSNKVDSISNMLARCFQWDEIVVEIEKCSLVCATCHREIEHRRRE